MGLLVGPGEGERLDDQWEQCRDVLESILGGKIEQRNERKIPGAAEVEGVGVMYYQDDGKRNVGTQFKSLLSAAGMVSFKGGGLVSEPCLISLPDGRGFNAVSYHGDVEGWRQVVEAAARNKGLLLAQIQGNRFVLSNGEFFPIDICRVTT